MTINRADLRAAVFLVVCLLTSGCSSKTKSAWIGSWRGPDSRETIQFTSDGRIKGSDRYGRPLTGSFELVDPEHVRMQMTMSSSDARTGQKMVDNSEGVFKLEVKGDSMAITEEGGSVTQFRRVR